MERHDVTVVVMTRDRRDELLASLGRHEAPVVVVDNGSSDGTAAAVRERFPGVDVVELGRNLGAAARTLGVERAATPFVAFADDDSWWAPGTLARGVDLLRRHPRVAVLTARILLGPNERLDPICRVLDESPLPTDDPAPGPRVLGFVACAAIVRRDAFLAVGGFDDVVRFPGEEERVAIDLAARGWEVRYAPELVVHHHPSPVRDRDGRAARVARSRFLTALMRRPWPAVARCGVELARVASGRAGLRAAVADVPEALRRRGCTPTRVERELRLLETG